MNEPNTWVGTSRESIFAYRPHEFTPKKNWYEKIPLTRYCKKKNISKKQAKTLIRKKWIGITQFRAQIWVHEICPEQIKEFLQDDGCRLS